MQPVSDRWARALATDHGYSVKVDVIFDGVVVAEDIAFTDGAVTVDRGSETRRSLSLTIPNPSDFPVDPADTYSVYGTRLYVEAGIRYLDGSTERVPLGTFVLTSIGGDRHLGPLTITAPGLETLLRRSVWEVATSTDGFGSPAGFIETAIMDAIPDASFVDLSTGGSGALATATWDAYSDKWAALADVAKSASCDLYCDANGTFVLADIPDPLSPSLVPVWDVSAGEGGVMVSADASLSVDDVYNRVVVTGENSADDAPPVVGVAEITDPADPLRTDGPLGVITKTYSSNLVTSEAQAIEVAASLLRVYRAPNREVSISAIPNPSLDAGDCIRAVYGHGIASELHIADGFTIPLTVGGDFVIKTVSGRDD
ncbi:DUF5047 domain-containing protein [Streptomyces sp. NPDC007063]|uniref:DUF5047 domain-containing protein n=1 Tax=Streptomyces sp. NPDC007063 TaxID=3364772 RepID=UPI0036B8C59C